MNQLTAQMAAKFNCKNGEYRWLCPRCAAVLGHVTRGLRPPTIKEIHDGALHKMTTGIECDLHFSVAVVELRAGYAWSEKKKIWLKPQKPRSQYQGGEKRDRRQFMQQKIERARAKGDGLTVIDEQWKIDQAAKEKTLPTEKPVLFADNFPAAILCHKPACNTLVTIAAIRGVL